MGLPISLWKCFLQPRMVCATNVLLHTKKWVLPFHSGFFFAKNGCFYRSGPKNGVSHFTLVVFFIHTWSLPHKCFCTNGFFPFDSSVFCNNRFHCILPKKNLNCWALPSNYTINTQNESPDRSVSFQIYFWQLTMGVHLLSPIQQHAVVERDGGKVTTFKFCSLVTFRQKKESALCLGDRAFFVCTLLNPT